MAPWLANDGGEDFALCLPLNASQAYGNGNQRKSGEAFLFAADSDHHQRTAVWRTLNSQPAETRLLQTGQYQAMATAPSRFFLFTVEDGRITSGALRY